MLSTSLNKSYGQMLSTSPNKSYGLVWAITSRLRILLHGIFHVRADGVLSPRQAAVPGRSRPSDTSHLRHAFCTRSTISFTGMPRPVCAVVALRLVDDAHLLVDALGPEVRHLDVRPHRREREVGLNA